VVRSDPEAEGEPGEMPAWAGEKPETSNGFEVKNEPGWAERELEAAATPIGAQDEMATKLAGWLAQQGRSEHEAVTLMWDWARRLDQKPRDPWEYEKIADKVRRMMEKEAAKPDAGAAGPLMNDTGLAGGGGDAIGRLAGAFDRLANQLKAQRARKEEPSRSIEVKPVTMGEFVQTTPSVETWLCREFSIPEECVFAVAGVSHAGKSLLTLDLAVSVEALSPPPRLLCNRCNISLGQARDNAEVVRRLHNYLLDPPARKVP
jgi:hypothetical protein